ncbi:unnamed protein product [Rotaria sordida]|uniref:HAT C-terminal dimerisation domain-containing protein n=1 Tax=Rotaria sordida TaxID=392033 RepID=A0A819SKL8_9BILA|nr:unnamed protein product [Rotaria sordida]
MNLKNEYFRSNEKRFNDLLLSIDKTDEIIDADLASTYIDADDTQVLNKKFQNDNLEALRLSDDLKFRFHTLKKRIVTCWNTVLIMLRSYADNIPGIEVILGRLKHFDLILTAAENEIVCDLIQFLSLFESTTTILSASKSYPTISLCLLLRIKHKPPSTSGFDHILDEIQNYLQLDISCDDVLQFWRSSGNAFPHLKRLAQIVLAVPATSTSSEQVFSTAGLILNAKRIMLLPENVGKIQMIHDNYNLLKKT